MEQFKVHWILYQLIQNIQKALAFLQLINTDTQLRDMFAYGEAE